MLSLLDKSGLENTWKKYDEKSSSPFASIVVCFHHTLSFSPDSIGLPNPQCLPYLLALSGTVPGTKHRAGEPKETVGRAVKGVALVGAQSGSPACALHSDPDPDPLGPVQSGARETEGTERNVSAALRRSGESFMNDNGCLRQQGCIV